MANIRVDHWEGSVPDYLGHLKAAPCLARNELLVIPSMCMAAERQECALPTMRRVGNFYSWQVCLRGAIFAGP